MESAKPEKVVICTPSHTKPHDEYLKALEASATALDEAGYQHGVCYELGSPYISKARADALRKALDGKADIVVFIDHDVSWRPEDLIRLVKTKPPVVGGTYRFKRDAVEFMGSIIVDADGLPVVEDGLIRADKVPAGFLKVTAEAVDWFMRKYPELIFGPVYSPLVDLFNHGAHEGLWWGEDYAFSRRWIATGEPLYIMPDLTLTHWSDKGYPGNFHEYLLACPGGINDPGNRPDQ